MRLFSPRKTTLLFVIRDKTKVHFSFIIIGKGVSFLLTILTCFDYAFFLFSLFQTPLENLEPILREDIQKVRVI